MAKEAARGQGQPESLADQASKRRSGPAQQQSAPPSDAVWPPGRSALPPPHRPHSVLGLPTSQTAPQLPRPAHWPTGTQPSAQSAPTQPSSGLPADRSNAEETSPSTPPPRYPSAHPCRQPRPTCRQQPDTSPARPPLHPRPCDPNPPPSPQPAALRASRQGRSAPCESALWSAPPDATIQSVRQGHQPPDQRAHRLPRAQQKRRKPPKCRRAVYPTRAAGPQAQMKSQQRKPSAK